MAFRRQLFSTWGTPQSRGRLAACRVEPRRAVLLSAQFCLMLMILPSLAGGQELDAADAVLPLALRGAQHAVTAHWAPAPSGAAPQLQSLIPRLHVRNWVLFGLLATTVAAVCLMMPVQGQGGGGGRGGRVPDPPGYNPEHERAYSYQTYLEDLYLWSLLAQDLEPSQQVAMIINKLGGPARDIARTLQGPELLHGGMVAGVHRDPVSFLLSHLATAFSPLSEETRLAAMNEIMQFRPRPGEHIDALLSRFRLVRIRATNQGGGLTMSWEGYAWILLRAISLTSDQMIHLLQPFQGRFPSTEPEFRAMELTLRRMGHIY